MSPATTLRGIVLWDIIVVWKKPNTTPKQSENVVKPSFLRVFFCVAKWFYNHLVIISGMTWL